MARKNMMFRIVMIQVAGIYLTKHKQTHGGIILMLQLV